MKSRHRLPPGPKGGYTKGGRPVKPRSAKERSGEAWRRIIGGFIVYTLKGRSLVFTRGETPLYTRYLAEVPGNVVEEGLLEPWAESQLDWKKLGAQITEGSSAASVLKLSEKRVADQLKVKKFLSEFWPARSRNKKG